MMTPVTLYTHKFQNDTDIANDLDGKFNSFSCNYDGHVHKVWI